jgi:AraC-like DNA-binding protein
MLSISVTDPPTRTVGVADHGRLFVAEDAPLHLVAVTRDVLLFPRGPALVLARGGRRWFVDPLSAVWCATGDELIFRSCSDVQPGAPFEPRTRFDWFAVEALIARAPKAVAFLRHAHVRRLTLLMPLPPALSLLQRSAHRIDRELPESPPRAWRPAAPVAMPTAAPEEPRAGTASLLPFDRTDSADVRDDKAVLARRARETLSRTYTETLPVGRIAQSLGCSEGHLSRTFRRWTGLTLLGYRHGLRMCAALDRLETDGDDLAALACDLGYASHSHFTSRFERTFGLTPSIYRKLAQSFDQAPENRSENVENVVGRRLVPT